MESQVAVVWDAAPAEGRIEVFYGTLGGLTGSAGVTVDGATFRCPAGPARLTIHLTDAHLDAGPRTTRVQVHAAERSFSFFARDVTADYPAVVEVFGAAVLPAADDRTYRQALETVRARGLQTVGHQIETSPETTFEDAAAHTRRQLVPTWLGLSRDLRIFSVGYDPALGYWGRITPRYHSFDVRVAEWDNRPIAYEFVVGRGAGCSVDLTRRLDDGCLPILHSVQRDGPVAYHLTAFATLEKSPLAPSRLRGTHWLAAYANTNGQMMTDAEKRTYADHLEASDVRACDEEVVCWLRVEATNTDPVPRYAYFRRLATALGLPDTYDAARGFSQTPETGRVYGIHRFQSAPLASEELAVLVPPGGSVVLDLLVPHQPIPADRAAALAQQDFQAHLDACRRFWQAKLATAAQVSLPDPAVEERLKAGLLHCDLAALGREPDGPVAATVGWYAPIGSESAPILQFFDAMGWHALAERGLQFFLERQRPDGFLQNFGGYELETGGVLWSLGEHYRYTRDDAWAARVRPHVLKACDYLLAWRRRNQKEAFRGRGYGLLDGRVADPQDFFHAFMLNGLACVGLRRAAEMLRRADPAAADRLGREADAFRQDIRQAYLEAMGRAPVVPLGDGTWIPTFAPWAEAAGPVSLNADGGTWYSHHTFFTRDSLVGSLYLAIGEVFEPDELPMTLLLRAHQELMTHRNAGFSQPYYCRHDYLHLCRGETAQFLQTYFHQAAALQDRETYSFWEHYYTLSEHKTHEEGWFLMQTRWMLLLDRDDVLRLLPGIPPHWLEDGQSIRFRRLASRFGPVSLDVRSDLAHGTVRAEVRLETTDRPPRQIALRLPHPLRRAPRRVEGGRYDPGTEPVLLDTAGGAQPPPVALYF